MPLLTQKIKKMKNKRLLLISLLLLGIGLTGLQAQVMYVTENNGSQTIYSLSGVGKITFSGGNAHVQSISNDKGVHALSDLRYINFTNLTTGISEPTTPLSASLKTYPNPVSDMLNIDLTSVKGDGTLSILTMEGKVLQTQKTSGNSIITLNLSHLSQGIYLCRYSTAVEIKTVKILKK